MGLHSPTGKLNLDPFARLISDATFFRAHELQEPCATFYTQQNIPSLMARLDKLTAQVQAGLGSQGFTGTRVKVERILNMRFEGTDTSLMVLPEVTGAAPDDYLNAFKRVYKSEFGFVLEGKPVIVDDIKVRGIGKTFDDLGPSIYEEVERLYENDQVVTLHGNGLKGKAEAKGYSVYFAPPVGRVENTPVYLLDNLAVGDLVEGPAMVIDETQTIVIIPGARALVTSRGLYIKLD